MILSWKVIFYLIIISYISIKIKQFFDPPSIPILEETWWSYNNQSSLNTDNSIRPFQINISNDVLKDLKERLQRTRQLTPPLEPTHHYGINSDLLKEILQYWQYEYNWREREKFLNQYPQFQTNIQGLNIHYLHVKQSSKTNKKVIPLLILHGWPGSIREFYELIPLLITPNNDYDFVFELIIPSLPGYGFSDAASKPGLGAAQMAIIFKNLMKRLGFNKFYVQGGDFGAIILHHLSVLYPETLFGFHSNMCFVHTPLSILKLLIGTILPNYIIKDEHKDRIYPLKNYFKYILTESGYFHIQATKPDTIGVGLNDSPAALAAYILEKFITGANKEYKNRLDGGLKQTYDDYSGLLDNCMIYWITGSMPTAIRLYSETFNENHMSLGIQRIPTKVPVACARFKHDFYSSDNIIHDIYPNLIHLSDYNGGHFAAFQLPHVLSKDIFISINKIEQLNK